MQTNYEEINKFQKAKIQSKALKYVKKMYDPEFKGGKNPIEYVGNSFKYFFEKREYDRTIQKIFSVKANFLDSGIRKFKMDGITAKGRTLIVRDNFVRVYYLADLPNSINPSLVFNLINLPIPFKLSYHVEGTSQKEMMKKGNAKIASLESTQIVRTSGGKARDQIVDREIKEIQEFVDNLVHDIEKAFYISLYVTISDQNIEQLEEYDRLFQEKSQDIGFTFNVATARQKESLLSTLPIAQAQKERQQILQTSAVTNLLPFLSRNINDPTGIFFGSNAYNGTLVLVDLFKADNANINIFGMSGSGKSVSSKLIMSRLAIRGVQNIIIDPEGEYAPLAESFYHSPVKFSRDHGINPFFTGAVDPEDFNAKKNHIVILKEFFRFFTDQKRYDGALLDSLLVSLYDKHPTPNLTDFVALCEKENAVFLSDILTLSDTGSMSGLFSSDKTIDLNSDMLVFDLSEIKEEKLKIATMYLLSNIIYNLIEQNKERRKMLYIDEAHKFLRYPATREFLIDLSKTVRKRNTGLVCITQNPEDFKEDNGGKTIITQAETSIILKQSYASMGFIRRNGVFPLTEQEEQALPTLNRGQALLIRQNERLLLNMMVLDNEKDLVFTSSYSTRKD
jgi:conjugal transfer ATP-binding protein TraC